MRKHGIYKNRDRLVLELGSQLDKIKDLDLLLERILENARIVTCADAGSIYVKTAAGKLSIRYSQNDTKQKESGTSKKLIYSSFEIPIGQDTIAGYVAANGGMLNIPDMYKIPKNRPYRHNSDFDELTNYRTVSSLTIPLKSENGDVIGVLQLLNALDDKREVVSFSSKLEPYAELFANIAAGALERAQLTRSLINRMITMSAMRDPKETAQHANRLGAFAVELYECWVRKNNVRDAEFERNRDVLRIAAMLHDIGKIGISDLILKKPGKLDNDERSLMEEHSFIGYQIFEQSFTEYDQISREIALRHHENWDGSGYPGHIDLETGKPLGAKRVGLKGEEIPLFARIVSICDVYDALSHARVYKDAWPESKVLKELKRLSGKKFDPELTELFIDMHENIKSIASRYPEKR